MTSIDHILSAQPGIIIQVIGDLTHTRFWAANVFVDHYSDYCYTHLMRGTSVEKTLGAKEAYKCLASTHRSKVCIYRSDNGRFVDPQFNE